MAKNDLHAIRSSSHPLTAESLDRLLTMMSQWWNRWSLDRIALNHGISRQRVHRMLASVGCTKKYRRNTHCDQPDSHRRMRDQDIAEARTALLNRHASRLTMRQRGALAWQAQGWIKTDIARRMRTTPQGVWGFIFGARCRLRRLRQKSLDDFGPIDVSDLEALLAP